MNVRSCDSIIHHLGKDSCVGFRVLRSIGVKKLVRGIEFEKLLGEVAGQELVDVGADSRTRGCKIKRAACCSVDARAKWRLEETTESRSP